ncbi:MAG: BRO family protein, partial [Ruminococcus flavefaciens]|nr:BRO family protein [Ruminococcus flavefaciens]
RQETKEVRKQETSTIQKFIEYAISQGSTHANNYYTLLTNLANKHCGIAAGERDKADQKTLLRLKSLETLIDMRLETMMNNNVPYKDIYTNIKELFEMI